ncbi:MAG TPA: hypothetical protein VHA78_05965 [Candidatus Peribacteraceae bacterium]|nr:hypothetical protein [Candidatus Peribacteraceae bacterium]
MSSLESELQDIAQKACSSDLPHGPLIESSRSLIVEHASMRPMSQQYINDAMKSFAAMTRLIMPGDTLHRYIEDHCAEQPLVHPLQNERFPSLATGWADEHDPLMQKATPGIDDRKRSMVKFTHQEVLHCLQICRHSPEVPLTLITLQALIDSYLSDVQKHIATIDKERAMSLQTFKDHWSFASNLTRFFMMAISKQLPEGSEHSAIDHIDQKMITDAFEFLEDIRAFEAQTPDLPLLGMQSRKFACPAQQLLRDVFVTNGTYMCVVEKMRAMRDGVFLSPTDPSVYNASRRFVEALVKLMEAIAVKRDEASFSKFSGKF